MSQTSNLWQELDNWRLRQHFKRVEAILRRRDISHLPPVLQAARETQLERLHHYAERSIFPRNDGRFLYTPCFIDNEGRECAVAHLLMQSQQNQLVQSIAQKAKYAYVPQMKFPELDNWAGQSGLTQEELALIQPGYWASFWEFLPVACGLWLLGFASILFNGVQIARKKNAGWDILISIVLAVPIFLFGLFLLIEGLGADHLSTAYDVPEYIHKAAGADVMPLMLGALFTLALVAANIGLLSYRHRAFPPLKGKAKKRRRKTEEI